MLIFTVLFALSACSPNKAENSGDGTAHEQFTIGESSDSDKINAPGSDHETGSETQTVPTETEGEGETMRIEIIIGNKTFAATLYNNAAAKALFEQLPLTLGMSELNGNEKYYYLDNTLPSDPSRPSGIKAGDLMLYGNSCLVLFYESFNTSYSYTALGKIDDPSGLADAVGSGGVEVIFKK